MKKLFYITALILTLSLVACAPSEVDDLFDESPAARLDNAVKNYIDAFKADGGRWHMQYFANGDEEGYNFIITFNNDGTADISTMNDYVNGGGFYSDKSLWDVVTDYGPVLTFNTYNNAFHEFSSPQSDGTGHGGDYEFRIISIEGDVAKLKGKKTNIDIIMTRLNSTDYPTDEDYFTALSANRAKAFSTRINDYVLTTGSGKRYICNDVTYMLWSFYPEGGTLLDNGEYMNAIFTNEGVRFMEPLEFLTENEEDQENVIKIQNFEFQPDGSLLCTDDGMTTIKGPDRMDAFLQTQVTWTFNKDALGGEFVNLYAEIVAKAKSVFNQTFNWIQFRYDSKTKKYGLYFKNGRYYGNIYLTPVKVDANTVRFDFDPSADDAFDNNGKTHYTRIEALQTLVQMLTTGEWVLSSDNVMVPNPMVISSKSNPANYITVGF